MCSIYLAMLLPHYPYVGLTTDEFCTGYPHNLYPTPGYWIECAGQTVPDDTIWDESEPEPELEDTSPQSDHPEKADQNIQASQVFISFSFIIRVGYIKGIQVPPNS